VSFAGVTPDGESFLMLRPLAAGGEQIVVIPNRAAERRAGENSARSRPCVHACAQGELGVNRSQ
jgi:hypothetical protein